MRTSPGNGRDSSLAPWRLSKIAAWRSGRTTLSSKIRQLRRFLANETIDPWPLYRPLAQLLLESANRHGPIHVLTGRLELSGPRILLMVALAYRRRALPLIWTVIKKRGHSLSVDQVRLLQRLEKIIPDWAQVVLIGDGEFRGVPLLVWLAGARWDFILRASGSTGLSFGRPAASDSRARVQAIW